MTPLAPITPPADLKVGCYGMPYEVYFGCYVNSAPHQSITV